MSWYLQVLKKYAVFDGRARRKEYWYFYLVNLVVSLMLALIDFQSGTAYLFGGLYSLGIFLPGLGVEIRRLHDIGRSGWWLFIGLVPLVGPIILIIWLATKGDTRPNDYGPSPKLAEAQMRAAAELEVEVGEYQ